MLLGKVNLFGTRQKTPLNPDLDLNLFVDLDLDITGWYALGHPDRREFLDAVAKRDPDTHFSLDRVLLAWAIFDDNKFEVFDIPVNGSQAIALVEDWGVCICDDCLA